MPSLKSPYLEGILVSPTDKISPLRVSDNKILGAGYIVPIINGVPDFVEHMPSHCVDVSIDIPSSASPRAENLDYRNGGLNETPPSWFKEEARKYQVLKSAEKGILLDVGAGQGNRSSYAGLGFDYIASDVEFNSRQRGDGESDIDIVADTHSLPIRAECVSAINATAVIEHLYFPELAAREWYRVLKPGGCLVGSCSFLEGEHYDSQWHLTHLGLFRILSRAGFENILIYPGMSLWEMHSNSLYLGAPFHKRLGRLHRKIYLVLTKLLSSETPQARLLRNAAVLNFAATKI